MDEFLADGLNTIEKLVDVDPFRLGDDVKEDVDGCEGASLGAGDLLSFEETGGGGVVSYKVRRVTGFPEELGTYDTRDSIEAS